MLTCRHVIVGNSDIYVRLKLEKDGIRETKWEKDEVVWENPELDAAILKIDDGKYRPLSLRPLDIDTNTGEAIYLWGYPFGGNNVCPVCGREKNKYRYLSMIANIVALQMRLYSFLLVKKAIKTGKTM